MEKNKKKECPLCSGSGEVTEDLDALVDKLVSDPKPAPPPDPRAFVRRWRITQDHCQNRHMKRRGLNTPQAITFMLRKLIDDSSDFTITDTKILEDGTAEVTVLYRVAQTRDNRFNLQLFGCEFEEIIDEGE